MIHRIILNPYVCVKAPVMIRLPLSRPLDIKVSLLVFHSVIGDEGIPVVPLHHHIARKSYCLFPSLSLRSISPLRSRSRRIIH